MTKWVAETWQGWEGTRIIAPIIVTWTAMHGVNALICYITICFRLILPILLRFASQVLEQSYHWFSASDKTGQILVNGSHDRKEQKMWQQNTNRTCIKCWTTTAIISEANNHVIMRVEGNRFDVYLSHGPPATGNGFIEKHDQFYVLIITTFTPRT